jgi:uncharacterized protein YecT (DUF1311 family)
MSLPRIAALLALGLLFANAATAATAASFDCAKASTKVEKLVCADPQVGALDERLAAAFKAIHPETWEAGSPEWGRWAPRIDDQRRWLRTVRDRCVDAGCLSKAYTERIATLERWQAPAPIDRRLAGTYFVEHTIALCCEEDAEPVPVSDCLSLHASSDDSFEFTLETTQVNAHSCTISGRLHHEGDVLRFVPGSENDAMAPEPGEPACDLRLRVMNGELQTVDALGGCDFHHCGARAHLDGLVFPRSGRQSGNAQVCTGPDGEPIK